MGSGLSFFCQAPAQQSPPAKSSTNSPWAAKRALGVAWSRHRGGVHNPWPFSFDILSVIKNDCTFDCSDDIYPLRANYQ
jgi:hypothetical protein